MAAPVITTTDTATTATFQGTAYEGDTSEHAETTVSDTEESEYLTSNGQPTGLEPNINPPHWPDDHRRVPFYREPVVNPAWYQIRGNSVGIRLFMWTMLSGCQLLQVCR